MEIQDIAGMSGVEITRENSRKTIAYSITGAFFVFLLISLIFTIFATDSEQFKNGKELISTISSVFGGLVGAVVGFYFGSESKS